MGNSNYSEQLIGMTEQEAIVFINENRVYHDGFLIKSLRCFYPDDIGSCDYVKNRLNVVMEYNNIVKIDGFY